MPTHSIPAGTAPVKPEYLLSSRPQAQPDDDGAESSTRDTRGYARDEGATQGGDPRARGGYNKLSKEQKKAQRGANKGRRFGKVRDELELCWKVANGVICEYGEECRFTHDVSAYLAAKPADLRIPSTAQISDAPPFGPHPTPESAPTPHPAHASVDLGTTCPVFKAMGECRYGFKCRFLGGHILTSPSDGSLSIVVDEERKARAATEEKELNFVGQDVQKVLRSKKYPFPITNAYLLELQKAEQEEQARNKANKAAKEAAAIAPAPETKSAVVVPEPEHSMDVDVPQAQIQKTEEPPADGVVLVSESALGEPEPVPQVGASDIAPLEALPVPIVAAPVADARDTASAPASDVLAEVIERRTGEAPGKQQEDTPDAPVRFEEKKRLDWKGKTYLAPLTTVGNLPFRRICVQYGVDITCSEMGLASSFLSGSKEEWSLVRRHPSERIFGVQIAGSKPSILVPTAEVLAKELGSGREGVDFVDVNCGCPIDLVFRTGSGSALLDAPGKLGKILIGMNRALGEIPVTVKLRTGVKDGKNTAHKLMPRVAGEWGAGCITLHGRTRQQRYTRLADWDYIKQCVEAVRAREEEDDLPPVPIFGGGDCFSSHDYWTNVEKTGVDGIMIGRGALIKPWIFTEIKERREWDISARERLEHIRDYAEFGLNHFGSDTTGVNATRRYLCEALSFQYRYVPIGLLEHLPGRINDRAPAFRGRSDLETLLASGDSQDWVKISEMFLGPAPESWTFTPKHKSNAYGSEEGQG